MSNNHGSVNYRIFLVRHGETDWNKTHRFQGRADIPLNQTGRDQARALALALRDETFSAIFSSPLTRALETAGFIKEYHPSVTITEKEGFLEMELGEFDGMDARLWAANFPDFRNAWQEKPASVRMPGGETLEEVQVRAIDALNRILQPFAFETTILVCAHNFVLLTMLCYMLEIPLDQFRQIKQGTASFSIIKKQGDRFEAEVVNERSHLE